MKIFQLKKTNFLNSTNKSHKLKLIPSKKKISFDLNIIDNGAKTIENDFLKLDSKSYEGVYLKLTKKSKSPILIKKNVRNKIKKFTQNSSNDFLILKNNNNNKHKNYKTTFNEIDNK